MQARDADATGKATRNATVKEAVRGIMQGQEEENEAREVDNPEETRRYQVDPRELFRACLEAERAKAKESAPRSRD